MGTAVTVDLDIFHLTIDGCNIQTLKRFTGLKYRLCLRQWQSTIHKGILGQMDQSKTVG